MTIEELIKEVLFIEEGTELTNETGPEDIESWDSLGHVNIITAVEDEFDIEITPEEIGDIQTIGDIKNMLAQKDINPE